MKIGKYIIIALAALTAAMPTLAENGVDSPYSRFGYGLLNDNASSAQRAMGGVGYAMSAGRQINVMNPASYAAIDSMTFLFDMGIAATAIWSKDGDKSANDFGGGLDYITMQFPIGKYMGGSLGLLPYSSVGYAFGSKITHGANERNGSGGLNQLYLGLSGRPFKGFSIGFNISYLFGNIINDTYVLTQGGSTSLFERVMEVRDWHIQIGAQYSIDLDSRNRLGLGLVYTPGKTLLGHAYGVYYDVKADANTDGTYRADTVGYANMRGHYSLPDTWGAGISYTWNNRLLVEGDFTYQPWKKAKYRAIEGFERTDFNDRWKIAAGVQYTPNPMRGSYVQRMSYRFGGYYNSDYIKVGDNSVREYGVSMGFGLPTVGRTVVNLGFEYRHRQAHPMPMVKENYFNITLGINFNERWFMQRKIE